MALPIALPNLRRGVGERGARDDGVLAAVGHAAVVLTPSHLTGVGGEVWAGDPVMHAGLGAPQPGKVALSLIGAGFAVAVALLVIDAVGGEGLVQPVPALRLVSVNDGSGQHAGLNRLHGLSLRAEREGEGLAVALADHDDDAALAGLVLGKPAVPPIFLAVLGADMAAEIGAIHLNGAGDGSLSRLGCNGLTKLVSHHERRPILHVQVTGEL